jgi:hypothetical protein
VNEHQRRLRQERLPHPMQPAADAYERWINPLFDAAAERLTLKWNMANQRFREVAAEQLAERFGKAQDGGAR